MKNKITFCIPSKNNLRYLKSSITSIKQNSSTDNDIIVYVDADTDGTTQWLDENGIRYIKNDIDIPKGIAYGYNRCIELAETDIVCMFHADMYMGKGFDTAILKYIKPLSVVSGTRIEPPLHPEGYEKIVKNFGMYPEDFMKEEFDSFVEQSIQTYKEKTTKGIFAPWAIYKEDIVSIGMHDEYFHSYHEDSDIFNRFLLNGYKLLQTWEGFVYHLTCRGGQFQDGIESITKDEEFHKMKNRAAKHYIRKWGIWIKNDEYHHPIVPPKYNIGFVLKGANLDLVSLLEPWCDSLYIDDEMGFILSHYYDKEQKNTTFNIKEKIFTSTMYKDDITVEIDKSTFTQEDFKLIQQLPLIIQDSGDIGRFQIGNLILDIKNITEYQQNLVKNG